MGTLYLVRHGQASFGADDYDQLSDLGHQQALRLGQHWAGRGLRFDAVLTGSLKRHVQTWDGIAQGAALNLTPLTWTGLNEYDTEAVIRSVHPHPREKADTPERQRAHFRLLRDGLAQWMAGTVTPQGMPSYEDFSRGVREALDHVRAHHHGQRVLIVSSGGPIATAVGQVLGLSPEGTIELQMRMRNSAVSECVFTPKRHALLTFNTLPHLEDPDLREWITYV